MIGQAELLLAIVLRRKLIAKALSEDTEASPMSGIALNESSHWCRVADLTRSVSAILPLLSLDNGRCGGGSSLIDCR